MKHIILFLLCLTILSAQQLTKEAIISSDNYYYGTGMGSTEFEATDIALSRLVKSISVRVQSEFKRNIVETQTDLSESVNNILSTYSFATITNHKKIVTQVDDQIEAFVYLDKNEVSKIYETRKQLVFDIYEKARQFEHSMDIGNALKWYYFSIILMNSIPEMRIEYAGKNLVTEIPSRITNLISETRFLLKEDRKIDDNERQITFNIFTNGNPVRSIDFNFWGGSGQYDVRAIDGEGVVRLFGGSTSFNKLTVKVKYSYYESKDEIKEVGELWRLVKKPPFNNQKEIELIKDVSKFKRGVVENNNNENTFEDDTDNSSNLPTSTNLPSNNNVSVTDIIPQTSEYEEEDLTDKVVVEDGNFILKLAQVDECDVVKAVGEETLMFLEFVDNGNLAEIKNYYSEDQFLQDKIKSVLTNNNPVIVDNKIDARINKTSTGWELRKIKVLNKYPSIKKQSSEYLVLDFDNEGSLYDVNYGVLDGVYSKVESAGKIYGNDWEYRQTILKFIEKYRTAFLCRDLATIDSLFAEEAVIIVGRLLKKSTMKDNYKYTKINDAQPDVQYIEYTKEQYLRNLSRLFGINQDIFIGFSTLDIRRKNTENVYGIAMRQNYNSSVYSDEGYLFLLVDFEQEYPQIYVRTWQPQEWDEKTLIQLSNFNINR